MAAPINPKGAKSDKLIRDALMIAVNREYMGPNGKTKKLTIIADKLVDLAMEGEIAAIKEVADRIDGKPPQALTGADGGNLVVEVHR